MISGKSIALIRAACTVTAGTTAVTTAVAFGQENHQTNGPVTSTGHFKHSWLEECKTMIFPYCQFVTSGTVLPDAHPNLPTTSADTATTNTNVSVEDSVKFWALVCKNWNGMYRQSIKDKDQESSCLCPKTTSKDNFFSPLTSLKNSTLNTVTASRHLFLVRHGQYHNHRKLERERCLTTVGREQLRFTGQRLKEIGLSYSKIVASTMKRAQESAKIIREYIREKELPLLSDSLLEEGAPIVPEPPLPNWKPNKAQYQLDGERIEAAFLKYFRKADISQSSDSHEIIVCHANVIRYFVCRALEAPPEAWLRMWLNHGSITWLTIKPSGRVILNALGASGYMPPSRLTAS